MKKKHSSHHKKIHHHIKKAKHHAHKASEMMEHERKEKKLIGELSRMHKRKKRKG